MFRRSHVRRGRRFIGGDNFLLLPCGPHHTRDLCIPWVRRCDDRMKQVRRRRVVDGGQLSCRAPSYKRRCAADSQTHQPRATQSGLVASSGTKSAASNNKRLKKADSRRFCLLSAQQRTHSLNTSKQFVSSSALILIASEPAGTAGRICWGVPKEWRLI